MRPFFAKLFGLASLLCFIGGLLTFFVRAYVVFARGVFDPNPTWILIALGLLSSALPLYIIREELLRRQSP